MALENENNETGSEVLEQRQRTSSWLNPFTWIHSWTYTSMAQLAQAERKILTSVWNKLEHKFVPISNGTKVIRTIEMNTSSNNTPLVMLHGMGAGVGLWILNLESLSKNRPLYAFDMMGFGRSSRPKFSNDSMLAELEFVESIEEWRKAMGFNKFILMGHSLGGYMASAYTIAHPDKVRHLILVDPWGFPEKPTQPDQKVPVPVWIKVLAKVLQPFNPLAVLRAAGPYGPGLLTRFRPDLIRKFEHLFDDDTIAQYVFHCNAQTPSGEIAFKHMTIPFGWAKHPMLNRMTDIPRSLPMTVIYGSRSWMDCSNGYQIKYIRNDSYVDVQVIKGAGHHVYADKAYQFNTLMNRVCQMIDNRMDFGQPFSQSVRNRSRNSESRGETGADSSSPRRRMQSESMPTFSKIQKQVLQEDQRIRQSRTPDSAKPNIAVSPIHESSEQSSDNTNTSFSGSSPSLPNSSTGQRVSFMIGDDCVSLGTLDDTDDTDLPPIDSTNNSVDNSELNSIQEEVVTPTKCASEINMS